MTTAGLLSAAAIGLCACLPYTTSLVIAVALFVTATGLFIFARKQKWGFSAIICLLIVSVVLSRHYITTVNGPKSCEILVGREAQITGTVIDEPQYKGANTYLYRLRTDKVSSPAAPQNLELCVWVEGKPLEAFDTFKANVRFNSLDKDTYISWYGQGIYLNAKCHSIEKTGKSDPTFESLATEIRIAVRSNITKNLSGDVSGILVGLVTNGTDYLDDETYGAFKTCGITHMVTVSGMHMAIVCTSLGTLLALLGIRKRYGFLLIIPLLVLYAAVSGFSPSAIRSVIMIIAVFSSGLFLRRGDGLNTLGATAVIMLAVSPYLLYNVSFLLSFSAMTGILITAPLQRKIETGVKSVGMLGVVIKYVTTTFVASAAAVIATFPVIVIVYGWVSTVSVLANIAISFVIDVLLIVGLIVVAAAVIIGDNPITEFLYKIIEILLYYVRQTAIFISKLPFGYIKFNISQTAFAVAAVFLLAAVVMLIRKSEIPRVLKAVGCAGFFTLTALLAANII